MDQGLLLDLLSMVPSHSSGRKPVLRALAESLRERGLHEDAAVAYAAADEHAAALLQYQAAGQWQLALALAGEQVLRSPPAQAPHTLAWWLQQVGCIPAMPDSQCRDP